MLSGRSADAFIRNQIDGRRPLKMEAFNFEQGIGSFDVERSISDVRGSYAAKTSLQRLSKLEKRVVARPHRPKQGRFLGIHPSPISVADPDCLSAMRPLSKWRSQSKRALDMRAAPGGAARYGNLTIPLPGFADVK